MLRMSVPYAIAAVLLTVLRLELWRGLSTFSLHITWLTVVYTLFQLPFATTMTYMTRDQNEKQKINIIRMAMSPIEIFLLHFSLQGFWIVPGGGMDSQRNWIILTAVCSGRSSPDAVLFCHSPWEVVVKDEWAVNRFRWKSFACLFKINTLSCCFCSLCFAMYQTFAGTMATYYCKWIVGDTKIIGNVMQSYSLFWYYYSGNSAFGKVMHLTSKRNWCIIGAIFIIAGSLVLLVDPPVLQLLLGGLCSVVLAWRRFWEWSLRWSQMPAEKNTDSGRFGLRTTSCHQSAATSGRNSAKLSVPLIGLLWANQYNGDLGTQSAQAPNISNLFIYGVTILGVIMINYCCSITWTKNIPLSWKNFWREAQIDLKKKAENNWKKSSNKWYVSVVHRPLLPNGVFMPQHENHQNQRDMEQMLHICASQACYWTAGVQ